jgi:hypothetical protein
MLDGEDPKVSPPSDYKGQDGCCCRPFARLSVCLGKVVLVTLLLSLGQALSLFFSLSLSLSLFFFSLPSHFIQAASLAHI